MSPLEFLSQPVWQCVAWVLVHFLWQGAVVAALAAALLALLKTPRWRYLACLAALALMVACPPTTFLWIGASQTPVVFADASLLAGAEDAPVAAVTSPHMGQVWMALLRAAQPWLVLTWLGGVFVLSSRLLWGLVAVHRLKQRRRPAPSWVITCTTRLGRRLGMKVPLVAGSHDVAEALALGFLRPLILLPAVWITELPPQALEAVIAHELAHIRRWDLWLNLLQRVIETLLFYHPAVWWLSRRLRAEREMCCDELAVALTGDRLGYVEVLELVARKRLARREPALATATAMGGNQMKLLERVRNVLGMTPRDRQLGLWPVGLLTLVVPLAAWLLSAGLSGAGSSDAKADDEKPRPPAVREGDRPAAERPTGDRPAVERRDGDRPAADRPAGERRDGDAPRPNPERPGEVRRPDAERLEAEVRARREAEARAREGAPRAEGGDRPATAVPQVNRPAAAGAPQGDMLRLLMELQQQVRLLQAEVRELRAMNPRPAGAAPRVEGERRPEADRPIGERRPEADRPAGERRPEGDRPAGVRPPALREGERDGDRPAPKAPALRDGERREGDRPDAVRPPALREGERDGERPAPAKDKAPESAGNT